MDIWQVKYVRIGDLIPNAKNPRKISKEKLERLQDKIQRLGFHNPVKTDENLNVLGGNQRLKALLKIAGKDLEIPVMYPTRPLTQAEKDEIVITDNISDGEWDWDILTAGWDKALTTSWGLDWGEVETEAEEDNQITEDEVPEEIETRCKRGDIWQLGKHRLMCGDSTSIADVEKLMDGAKADMVFTDPPYGMNLDTDYSSMKSEIFKGGIGGKKYEQGMVDDFKPEMISTILTTFDYVKEIFLWGADYFAELLPNKNDGSWVVWDKRANGDNDLEKDLSSDKMYGSCFELCWSKNKHKRDIARIKWAGIFGMYGEDKKRFHPTQKPQELVKWFLDRYSKEKQTIVDLFGGSGSTLIACEQLDRKCYMMELDPHYCDVILQRYIKFKNSDEDVFLLKDGNKIPYSEAHF